MTHDRRPRNWGPWLTAGLVAALLCLGLCHVGAPAIVVPKAQETGRRNACEANVSRLLDAFRAARKDDRFDPKLHGAAQIFSWIPSLPYGEERRLVCPGDRSVFLPETDTDARRWHPRDPREVGHDLTSFAVRDFEKFPVADGDGTQIILCDRQGDDGRTPHHKGGIVVGFGSGEARFMTREDLGIASDAEIVVGPDSPNPELRKMERP